MPASRAQKKLLAIERARRRLKHRLEDIDWEEETLIPKVQELQELEAQGKKVDFEIEAGDES